METTEILNQPEVKKLIAAFKVDKPYVMRFNRFKDGDILKIVWELEKLGFAKVIDTTRKEITFQYVGE